MKFNRLLVPILFLFIFLFLVINRVNDVECFVENNPCPPELAEKSNILKGSSFFFANFEKKLQENELKNNIYILKSVSKKLPGTVVLTFEQEEIEYAILVGDETKFIGKSGTIIPNNAESQEVLTIKWKSEQSPIIESQVENEYHQLFQVITHSLARTYEQSPKITWNTSEEIILDIPGHPPFIFDSQTLETHIKKVDTIIKARELDEIDEPILEIDMRFDLPVLRTRQ